MKLGASRLTRIPTAEPTYGAPVHARPLIAATARPPRLPPPPPTPFECYQQASACWSNKLGIESPAARLREP